MVALQVTENDVITSNQLPEPARVIKVIPDATGVRIMAVGTNTNQFYDRIFQPGEVQVRRVTFAADGERFRLAALATRIRAAAAVSSCEGMRAPTCRAPPPTGHACETSPGNRDVRQATET